MASSKVASGSVCREKLTVAEQNQMTIGPAITTITFFRGDPAQASIAIGSRLAMVVAANPWLKGTLERSKDKASPGLYLVYPAEVDLKDANAGLLNPSVRCGKPRKKPVLDETMEFCHVCEAVGGTSAEVLKGSSCIGNHEPLLALSVLADAKRPSDTFAMIFSVSHVIVDGFTYYRLLSMISKDGLVEALSPTRKHSIMEQCETACGQKEFKWLNSVAIICNVICGMMCGRKPVIESYYVDEARIRERKTAAIAGGQGGVEFVSTNDVLCSDFGVATRAGVLLMPINFRERLPEYTAADAGNYESALVFRADDYADPSLIRKTVQSGPPTYSRSVGGAMPGCCATMCSVRLAMVTSWLFSFFQELEVEGCEHMMHMPHCDTKMVPFDLAVVYRPRRGESAVTFFVRSLDRAGLQRDLPLGAAVQISTPALAQEVIQVAPAST